MGITTGNLGLYKPAVGEVSWGTLRNANEDVIDLALGTQHSVLGVHKFVTVANGTGYVQLPDLTTTQRNSLPAVNGMMVYNSSVGQIQSYEAGAWGNIALGSSQFTDNAFRINDDGDITKQIAFQASGITTGTVRTITMPDADIDLGDVAANTTHSASDGTDHANVVLNDTHRASDGTDHSNVVLNDTHRASDGTDHSNVVLNDTHRASDGTDHSNVVLNDTHRASDGTDHADVVTNTTHSSGDGSDHADVATNTLKITNATHTDDVTGSGSLTVAPVAITNKPTTTVSGTDLVLVADVDDSDNLKQVTAASIGALAGPGATTYTSLTDTPANFTGSSLQFARVNVGETALEFATPAGTSDFTGLTDTPANYTGDALKTVRVNAGETALEFVVPSGGATLELDVTQANAFSVDEWVYHNGTTYELADASGAVTAESIGIITAATGADFTVQFGGRITGLTGLTAGEAHFLSDSTPGAITATAPTTANAVVKPVLVADSTTTGFIFNMRGTEITSTTSFVTSFQNSDLVGGVLTVNHNLGNEFVIGQVYDDNKDAIGNPDNFNLVDANSLTIDLSSFTVTADPLFWTVVLLDIGTTNNSSATDLNITSQAQGDILYFNGTIWTRLPAGTAGQRLETQGSGSNPTWEDEQSDLTGDVTSSGLVTTVVTNADLTGDVTSSGNATTIPSGTVTTAMRANGTDGEIPTWNSSGVASNVPVGTSGDVLTSGGTGVAPTFQALAAAGMTVETFTADGTFTSNASTTLIYVSMCGGGGGGGGGQVSAGSGAGGSGGAGVAMLPLIVSASTAHTLQVGTGGNGGAGGSTSGAAGGVGQDTIFDSGGVAYTVSGGNSGPGANGIPSSGALSVNTSGDGAGGGTGGADGLGGIHTFGSGAGGEGVGNGGGGGGSSLFGTGGYGGYNGGPESEPGELYGGGGAGGSAKGSPTGKNGEAGADGIIIVMY